MPSRVFARSNLGCHLSAGPPYQAATGLPRFSLAADGSCRARQVPPVHITFHQTKVLGTDTTRTGLSASAASERGAYGQVRISPSPRPAISVRIRPTRPSLCPSFSVRATLLRAHVTTAVTDMGTPGIHEEVCVCTVPHSAGLLHANHVGRITFRAPTYRRARMDQRAAATTTGPTRRYTSASFVLCRCFFPPLARVFFVRAAADPFRTVISFRAYGLRHGVMRPATLGTSPSL